MVEEPSGKLEQREVPEGLYPLKGYAAKRTTNLGSLIEPRKKPDKPKGGGPKRPGNALLNESQNKTAPGRVRSRRWRGLHT